MIFEMPNRHLKTEYIKRGLYMTKLRYKTEDFIPDFIPFAGENMQKNADIRRENEIRKQGKT